MILHIIYPCTYFKGIKLMTSKYGEVTCKAKLLIIIADLPAKAALLNCNQYNGQYGCATCLHPGQQVKEV